MPLAYLVESKCLFFLRKSKDEKYSENSNFHCGIPLQGIGKVV